MKNILLVGNGFDLAHELPTKYEHFLFILKNWSEFQQKIEQFKSGKEIEKEDIFYTYFVGIKSLNDTNLEQLDIIIKNNSWIKYFCQCEAEIDGWIDFEKEIYPVIDLFEFIFNCEYNIGIPGQPENRNAYIKRDLFSTKRIRTAILWTRYIGKSQGGSFFVRAEFTSKQYGILKKKIIQSLRDEFDGFIKAFEIYLYEFVYKREGIKILRQIKKIGINNVISFNYTHTEELYGIQDNNVHHIHGMIRTDLDVGNSDIVMGLNEQREQNIDFIYFVKYFQRIQRATGVGYKEFVDKYDINSLGRKYREEFELYIYGHSLDETDEDILKFVIGDIDEKGDMIFKPKKIIVFFYDFTDYEQKVINLIKLYGRNIVEKNMEKEKFKFVKINTEDN